MADDLRYAVFVANPAKAKGVDVFLQHAAEYFSAYRGEHRSIQAGEVKTLPRNDMLALLEALAASGQRHVIIVSHADREGLFLGIGKDKNRAPWYRMALLLLWAVLERLERRARDSGRDEDLFALRNFMPGGDEPAMLTAAQTVSALTRPGESKSERKFRELIQDRRRTAAELQAKAKSPEELKKEKKDEAEVIQYHADREVWTPLEKWKANLLRELAVDQAEAAKYVAALRRVHALRLDDIQIRGCRLGESPDALGVLGLFLGAFRIAAPRIQDVFAKLVPPKLQVLKGKAFRSWAWKNEKGKTLFKVPPPSAWARKPGPRGQRQKPTAAQFRYSYRNTSLAKDGNEVYLFVHDKDARLVAEDEQALEKFLLAVCGPLRGGRKPGEAVLLQWIRSSPPAFPKAERWFGKHLVELFPGRFDLETGQFKGLGRSD